MKRLAEQEERSCEQKVRRRLIYTGLAVTVLAVAAVAAARKLAE